MALPSALPAFSFQSYRGYESNNTMPYIDRVSAVNVGGTNLKQMSGLDKIHAATNDKEMKIAVVQAQAHRAMSDLGLKSDKITRIMAGASKLTAKDIDNAMLARATEYADQENERRRISKNKLNLDPTEVYSVDSAMKELFSFEKRIRLKNVLHAAGLIA
jgi:hypothetical protein